MSILSWLLGRGESHNVREVAKKHEVFTDTLTEHIEQLRLKIIEQQRRIKNNDYSLPEFDRTIALAVQLEKSLRKSAVPYLTETLDASLVLRTSLESYPKALMTKKFQTSELKLGQLKITVIKDFNRLVTVYLNNLNSVGKNAKIHHIEA